MISAEVILRPQHYKPSTLSCDSSNFIISSAKAASLNAFMTPCLCLAFVSAPWTNQIGSPFHFSAAAENLKQRNPPDDWYKEEYDVEQNYKNASSFCFRNQL